MLSTKVMHFTGESKYGVLFVLSCFIQRKTAENRFFWLRLTAVLWFTAVARQHDSRDFFGGYFCMKENLISLLLCHTKLARLIGFKQQHVNFFPFLLRRFTQPCLNKQSEACQFVWKNLKYDLLMTFGHTNQTLRVDNFITGHSALLPPVMSLIQSFPFSCLL